MYPLLIWDGRPLPICLPHQRLILFCGLVRTIVHKLSGQVAQNEKKFNHKTFQHENNHFYQLAAYAQQRIAFCRLQQGQRRRRGSRSGTRGNYF